jgi:hypothetical protein
MVCAMTKTNDVSPDDDGEFAAAVNKLYRHAVKGDPKPFQGNIGLEVRQAAFGLALLHQLVEQNAKSMRLSADIPSSGIGEALGILDHLTTGKDHPISKHIKGIHSGKFRPQHAEANSIERFRHMIIVGVVRAYMAATGAKQAEALRQVVRAAKRAGLIFSGINVPENQIRMWDRLFRKRGDRGPDAVANDLLRSNRSPTKC